MRRRSFVADQPMAPPLTPSALPQVTMRPEFLPFLASVENAYVSSKRDGE
jgi:hypothetical protein